MLEPTTNDLGKRHFVLLRDPLRVPVKLIRELNLRSNHTSNLHLHLEAINFGGQTRPLQANSRFAQANSSVNPPTALRRVASRDSLSHSWSRMSQGYHRSRVPAPSAPQLRHSGGSAAVSPSARSSAVSSANTSDAMSLPTLWSARSSSANP
jgi:hypothetical protein